MHFIVHWRVVFHLRVFTVNNILPVLFLGVAALHCHNIRFKWFEIGFRFSLEAIISARLLRYGKQGLCHGWLWF